MWRAAGSPALCVGCRLNGAWTKGRARERASCLPSAAADRHRGPPPPPALDLRRTTRPLAVCRAQQPSAQRPPKPGPGALATRPRPASAAVAGRAQCRPSPAAISLPRPVAPASSLPRPRRRGADQPRRLRIAGLEDSASRVLPAGPRTAGPGLGRGGPGPGAGVGRAAGSEAPPPPPPPPDRKFTSQRLLGLKVGVCC